MNKISFLLVTILIPFFLVAQNTGIQFTNASSWKEVLDLARAEGKYIFVDCHTTWCAPCKAMSSEIFPMQEVGDFFNKRFISVYLQMDTSKKDNDFVKGWYSDASMIKNNYTVKNYPTFLYFSPDGALVHRTVGSLTADRLIDEGNAAMNPERQYMTLMKKVEREDVSPRELRNGAKAAQAAYEKDKAAKLALRSMEAGTINDFLSKEGFEFLSFYTVNSQTTTDVGFRMILENSDLIDSTIGKNASAQVITEMLGKEVRGEIDEAKDPNWDKILDFLQSKYPRYAERTLFAEKTRYFSQNLLWNEFVMTIEERLKSDPLSIDGESLSNFVLLIATGDKVDEQGHMAGLKWSKQVLAIDEQTAERLFFHAVLFYKLGKQQEAVAWQQKAVNKAADEDQPWFQQVLKKMTSGKELGF
ncbi:MAG: thioredoxin fold domain-containing protein [Sphingobacterium sp.]|jgi:thioredoxin-related protein|nr:thioredoxin fold domain-containing protein [Sphingobacterium sp.]